MSDSIIEEYRESLKALHKLRRKYEQKNDMKMLRVLDEEIDGVAHTLNHLQKKGAKRWKWESQ